MYAKFLQTELIPLKIVIYITTSYNEQRDSCMVHKKKNLFSSLLHHEKSAELGLGYTKPYLHLDVFIDFPVDSKADQLGVSK